MKLPGLRMARKRNDLTQFGLQEKTGITEARLCRLETGRSAPTDYELSTLANALGVTQEELRYGSKPE